MESADLYIIAAGRGSRMKSDTPKALVTIDGEPCLTSTLLQIGHKFRKVFVVTNILLREQWAEYFAGLQTTYPDLSGSVFQLPIKSGLGDGHATLEGIMAAERLGHGPVARDLVVAWGDVFFPHAAIIDELLSVDRKGPGLLPAVHEPHPYVALMVNEHMQCLSAEHSKFGEQQLVGYHDQSVFRFEASRLHACLRELHNALWKNGRYIAPDGELSLLYSFHHFYNARDPAYVYETKYPTRTFNTVEEVVAIQREIRARWTKRFHLNGAMSHDL